MGGAAPGPDGELSLAGEEKPKYPDGSWYLGVSSEGGVGESKERGDGSEKEEDDGNQQREAMLVNGDILTAKEALLQVKPKKQQNDICRPRLSVGLYRVLPHALAGGEVRKYKTGILLIIYLVVRYWVNEILLPRRWRKIPEISSLK